MRLAIRFGDPGGEEAQGVMGGGITADSLDIDDAAAAAEGCPMLPQGGSVEVGEVIPA